MADSASKEPGKLGRLQARVQALIDEDAVAETDAQLGAKQRFLHFWILVGRMFMKNRAPVRAASLAYTTLLALVPLLAISLSVAAQFLPSDVSERRAKLVEWIELGVAKAAPTLGLTDHDGTEQRGKVANQIVDFVERINFGKIGATAAAGLLIVAIGLLRTVEGTLNDFWGVTRPRSLLLSIVFYWATITLGPVVVILAKGANYLQFLEQYQGAAMGLVAMFLSVVVPPLIMAVAFGALYFWMPNTRVHWQAALVGGAVASVLWTLNGRLSALYNTRVLTYNAIYGSLGALPLFLVGLYFTWLIVLFGAQVAYVFQHRRAYLQERLAGRIHQQAREFAALRLMTQIGARFAAGNSPLNVVSLAEVLAVPPNLAKELLRSLVAARLLNETSGAETAYVPARPLAQISVADVLAALRRGTGSDLVTAPDGQRPVVRAALAEVQKAADAEAGALTLEELVRRGRAGVDEPAFPIPS